MRKAKFGDYSFDLRPLSKAQGGGWLITWRDLPGCMSDGETPEEAIEWMNAHEGTYIDVLAYESDGTTVIGVFRIGSGRPFKP